MAVASPPEAPSPLTAMSGTSFTLVLGQDARELHGGVARRRPSPPCPAVGLGLRARRSRGSRPPRPRRAAGCASASAFGAQAQRARPRPSPSRPRERALRSAMRTCCSLRTTSACMLATAVSRSSILALHLRLALHLVGALQLVGDLPVGLRLHQLRRRHDVADQRVDALDVVGLDAPRGCRRTPRCCRSLRAERNSSTVTSCAELRK